MEDQLYGSRIGVASVEVRMPLFGTSQFGLIDFPYFPTELTLFADAGMAWGETGDRFSTFNPAIGEVDPLGTSFADQTPVFSAGAAARVNVLGALILEFYYAFPFSREDDVTGVFGVNLSPGW
jgi:outer membrane protein assembly factor BamA